MTNDTENSNGTPDQENRFVVGAEAVEELGYLGKDGKFHKELAPELRADLPPKFAPGEEPGDE